MASKKRILFFFHDALRTGASMVLLRLVNKLAEGGEWEIHVLLPDEGPLREGFNKEIDVYIKPEKEVSDMNSLMGKLRRKVVGKEVNTNYDALIKKVQPDIVYLNTVAFRNFTSSLSGKERSFKLIWHFHEQQLALRVMGVRSIDTSMVDLVVANSEETSKTIVDLGNGSDNIKVVHPSIDEQFYSFSNGQRDKELFTVGCVGTMLTRKGAELFLITAARFRSKYPDVNIMFVWIGNARAMKGEIEWDMEHAALENTVKIIQPTNDLSVYYQSFDVYFCPSKEESFGLAPAEAMATRCPVLCFENAGTISRLTKESQGFLVPYLDVEAAVDKLAELSKDPDQCEKSGQISHDYVKRYATEVVAFEWQNMLSEMVK